MKKLETIVFPGARDIIATAIKKTSKNNYYVYIIEKDWATHIRFDTLKKAKLYIKEKYTHTCGKEPGEKYERSN